MSITTPSGISTNTITTDGTATVDKILTAKVTCDTKFTVNSVTITAAHPLVDEDADAITIKDQTATTEPVGQSYAAITSGWLPITVTADSSYYLQFTVPAATLAVAGTYTVTVAIKGMAAPKTGILVIDVVGAVDFEWTS